MKFRHLAWVMSNSRPWVCRWNENFGARPIKDSTMRILINKGYFPYEGKTPNKKRSA